MEKITLKDIKHQLAGCKVSHFLTCASFEDRSSSLVKVMLGQEIDDIGIFATIDFAKEIEESRNHMCHLLQDYKVQKIDLKISDPVFSFINIVNYCVNIFVNEPVFLVLDISTFTHEHLLILFRVIRDYKRESDTVFVSYTSVQEYSYNITEHTDKWLTKGVKELRSIIGFPGYFDPTRRNHLIILVGFEVERVIKLIESFEFEMVTLIIGSSDNPMSINNQIINEHRYDQILTMYSHAKKMEVSLTNPQEVKTTILNYIKDFDDYNTVIAPMNNKISTLGVGYAAMENTDIQLFYMQANIYNTEGYSKSEDCFYLGKL
ncbi:DUF6293 family protein [Sphingobacterium detergens]|uniref:Uncharacterized protein n=1 Tax=Sphingobacterium detergens TaxID=1145106 RepID=A0A420BF71_SPHD1|nr:DUF6293 family protein [Sphingobacterium detergens]RKE55352.1 hypothetical protein DFQ12_0183 [Sphingobacterium detergens]